LNSQELLSWLSNYCREPLCLYCRRVGFFSPNNNDWYRVVCERCNNENYEVEGRRSECSNIYFSVMDFRLSIDLDMPEIDGHFEVYQVIDGELTWLTVIPAFRPDFSNRQALRDKIAGYLNFL
jgi:hypothetical protein